MKVFGLLGYPLGHSFSKNYFTQKFLTENLADYSYQNFELTSLQNEIPDLKNNPLLCGLNVTIPYKSEIISFLDLVTEVPLKINACNCIKITNGKWIGYNTDVTGFEKSFTPKLQAHHKKALILGTGGSSKAVAYVLSNSGIEYLFVSRSKKNLPGVIPYSSVTPFLIQNYPVIINTTPSGMFPNIENYPQIPYESVSAKNYFFDLIYNPGKTIFLSKAEAKGAIIENGKNMLAIQAEESWKIWTS